MNSSQPNAAEPAQRLVVAITARALFDLEHSHALFQADGLEAYEVLLARTGQEDAA